MPRHQRRESLHIALINKNYNHGIEATALKPVKNRDEWLYEAVRLFPKYEAYGQQAIVLVHILDGVPTLHVVHPKEGFQKGLAEDISLVDRVWRQDKRRLPTLLGRMKSPEGRNYLEMKLGRM